MALFSEDGGGDYAPPYTAEEMAACMAAEAFEAQAADLACDLWIAAGRAGSIEDYSAQARVLLGAQ